MTNYVRRQAGNNTVLNDRSNSSLNISAGGPIDMNNQDQTFNNSTELIKTQTLTN